MVDHLLTKKKKKWVNQFKPTVSMKGTALHHNEIDAKRLEMGLMRMINLMTNETEKAITRLYKGDAASAHFAQDADLGVQARVLSNQLMSRFDQLFNKKANGLAASMINATKASSRSTLNSSLKELSGGLSIKTDLMTPNLKTVLVASSAESVGLIKSVPEEYLNRVQGSLMRSISGGGGLKEVIAALKKYKGMTHKRAKMIAHDQTRKVYTSINRARMQAVGITKVEWLHSGGSNAPRPTHVAMNRKVFKLSEGMYDSSVKEFVQPGQLPNCRCTYRPIITFEDGEHESD